MYFTYGILSLWDIQLTFELQSISPDLESCEDSNVVSVFTIGCKINKLRHLIEGSGEVNIFCCNNRVP